MVRTTMRPSLRPTRPNSAIGRAELDALVRVAHRLVERGLRHADAARRGLDARALERGHQLLEGLALFAAEQRARRDCGSCRSDSSYSFMPR